MTVDNVMANNVQAEPSLTTPGPAIRPSYRWLASINQRLLGTILLLLYAVFFLGPPFFPTLYWAVTLVMLLLLTSNAVRLAVGLLVTAVQVRRYSKIDWADKCRTFVPVTAATGSTATTLDKDQSTMVASVPLLLNDIKHVIFLPNYKEEEDTLAATLDVLAHHKCATSMYKIILAMEGGEKGSDKKAERLVNRYQSQFLSMRYTVHPLGVEGEARGKSSNLAWAASYYARHWAAREDAHKELLTVVDADIHITQQYFDCITYKYLRSRPETRAVQFFAPTLIFDRNANDVPFVVRLADIAWSSGLLGNFQMPVKFPCAVYSISMTLAHRTGGWDKGHESFSEDMHMALKCWTATRMEMKFTPIYVPASCTNVHADTYFGCVRGRFDQAHRHLWASIDFGYLNTRLLSEGCWWQSPARSMLAIYLLFEIFFQPYFGLFQLSGQLIYPASMSDPIGQISMNQGSYVRVALVVPALVIAMAYEYYHHLACTFRSAALYKMEAERVHSVVTANVADGRVDSAVPIPPAGTPHPNVAFRRWWQVLDWAGLPFCLVFYYIIPGVSAMLKQLVTNRMDFQVSLKPPEFLTGMRKPVAPDSGVVATVVVSGPDDSPPASRPMRNAGADGARYMSSETSVNSGNELLNGDGQGATKTGASGASNNVATTMSENSGDANKLKAMMVHRPQASVDSAIMMAPLQTRASYGETEMQAHE